MTVINMPSRALPAPRFPRASWARLVVPPATATDQGPAASRHGRVSRHARRRAPAWCFHPGGKCIPEPRRQVPLTACRPLRRAWYRRLLGSPLVPATWYASPMLTSRSTSGTIRPMDSTARHSGPAPGRSAPPCPSGRAPPAPAARWRPMTAGGGGTFQQGIIYVRHVLHVGDLAAGVPPRPGSTGQRPHSLPRVPCVLRRRE